MASGQRGGAVFGRVHSVAIVVGAIAGALVIVSVALQGILGVNPSWVRRAEVLDPGEFQRIGRQIAAVERESRNAAPLAQRPLVVVLGLSTAREDIDASILGPTLCNGSRVLNLGSSGGSYRELAFYLQTLRESRLRSAVTLLAVHPVWLAGRVHSEALASARVDSSLASPEPSTSERAKRWVWLYSTRRGIHAVLMNALWDARVAVLGRFEGDTPALFPGGIQSPWAARHFYSGSRADSSFLAGQLAAWTGYGWFDPGSFGRATEESESLRTLLDDAQGIGPPPVIVLMPEHSVARQKIPAVAATAFMESIAGRQLSPVIDLRQRLHDSLFYDYAHVNAAGRTVVSGEIARIVASRGACE